MSLPFFFDEQGGEAGALITLPEDTSRHVVSVLRMKPGEKIRLANGQGRVLTAEIASNHKKNCTVQVMNVANVAPPITQLAVAMSLLKNNNRFEWFLEKATEIGVTHIYPLICQRTEKQFFRAERMKGILTSAMLQSQQAWLPALLEPMSYEHFINSTSKLVSLKLVAHCLEQQREQLTEVAGSSSGDAVILIGPEGDFSEIEIDLAIANGYRPVMIGNNRLRTETAGVVAASILKMSRL